MYGIDWTRQDVLLRLSKEAKNLYYVECPYCGAHLDPGEKCECQNQTKKRVDENENKSTGDGSKKL